MNFKLTNILWVYAFLLIVTAYIAGLFIDLTGDSGLYAAISRQMVESGDWFNLKINGKLYFEKPHLIFWLSGSGIKLFGNTNFGFKIFPLLYGWLGFFFTYKLGKTIFSPETGRLAALLLVSSQIYFLYSLDIHTDTILQTGVTLALWQLAAYLKHKKIKNFILGFIGVGLAMLAKGPVGAFLPFLSVLFYLLIKKQFRQILHPKWLIGIIIVLIIISPALLHLYKNFGWLGVEFYFFTNNIGRISGEYAGSNTDPFFYLYNMIWIFLPWTILVFIACFNEIKSWISNNSREPMGIYLLGSVLLYLFVISIARGKAPNYFLIAVAPITAITAKFLVVAGKGMIKRLPVLIRSQIIFVGIFAAVCLLLFTYLSFVKLWISTVLVFIFTVSIVYLAKQIRPALNYVLLISTIVIGSLNLFLNTVVLPELFSYQGARQVLKIFNENKNAGSKLYNFETEGNEIYFYSDEIVEQIDDWDKLRSAMKKEFTWLYTNEIKYNDILKMNFDIDTVYTIRHRGMNNIDFEFLNPSTRENSLIPNYLIVTPANKK